MGLSRGAFRGYTLREVLHGCDPVRSKDLIDMIKGQTDQMSSRPNDNNPVCHDRKSLLVMASFIKTTTCHCISQPKSLKGNEKSENLANIPVPVHRVAVV
jgi:hypothetical protein